MPDEKSDRETSFADIEEMATNLLDRMVNLKEKLVWIELRLTGCGFTKPAHMEKEKEQMPSGVIHQQSYRLKCFMELLLISERAVSHLSELLPEETENICPASGR